MNWEDIAQGISRFFWAKWQHIRVGGVTAAGGYPAVLDSDGKWDASLIDDADVDHGSVGGLADDDHTQYYLVAGTRAMTKLVLTAGATLTIASGVVTATNSRHAIDTESAAATDDLDTINGGSDGMLIRLRPVSGARDVVVKHATGNIGCAGGVDFTMDEAGDRWTGMYDSSSSTWIEISRRSVT